MHDYGDWTGYREGWIWWQDSSRFRFVDAKYGQEYVRLKYRICKRCGHKMIGHVEGPDENPVTIGDFMRDGKLDWDAFNSGIPVC